MRRRDPLTRFGEHVLIALDGTEYRRPAKVPCEYCSSTSGSIAAEVFPLPTLLPSGHTLILPPPPAVRTSAGWHDKKDRESRAGAPRRHGAGYAGSIS